MSAQHTPGPWTYEGDHTHRRFNVRMLGHLIGAKDEAKHICTVNNLPAHVLANRDPSTAEANALLIAAAPELLSLLMELTDIEGPCPGTGEWAGKVKAAIAKATGAA